jgi:YD repeat-containing protein
LPTSIQQKLGASPFASYTLAYDNGANTVGLLTGVTESAGTVAYGYDALYRLTSESRTGPYANSHTHGYDLAGNRTSIDGTAQTFDDANKQTGLGLTYD